MAISNATKHANFIARSVSAAQAFIQAYNQLVGLRAEWDSLNYVSAIVDADFSVASGSSGTGYPYLNAAALQSFYVSEGNLATFWSSGNGTNISNLVP